GASAWNERLYDSEASTPLHEPPDLPGSTCLLDPAVVQGLSRLAEQTASTLFIVLLTAYGVALRQVLDSPDLLIGVFVSGRGGEAGLVAMAVNMVLVRLRLEGITETGDLVGRVKQAWRPVRRFEAAPIHALRRLAQRRAAVEGDAAADEDLQPRGNIPERVQISINFLDMRNTVFDVPGVVSRTTHPQSAFPLNDVMLVMFREHDDTLRLRLINGSGTPRLSARRLDALLDVLAGLLRNWAAAATGIPLL
ncbi:MAG: condensation domain-containing protein, partial [Janthinobacterium lividum]